MPKYKLTVDIKVNASINLETPDINADNIEQYCDSIQQAMNEDGLHSELVASAIQFGSCIEHEVSDYEEIQRVRT